MGVPKRIQSEINKSTIEVTNMEVTNPTPDTVRLKMDNTIRSDSHYHPKLDAFRASLSLDGQEPFVYMDIPEAKSQKETFVTVDQQVSFESLEKFTA